VCYPLSDVAGRGNPSKAFRFDSAITMLAPRSYAPAISGCGAIAPLPHVRRPFRFRIQYFFSLYLAFQPMPGPLVTCQYGTFCVFFFSASVNLRQRWFPVESCSRDRLVQDVAFSHRASMGIRFLPLVVEGVMQDRS